MRLPASCCRVPARRALAARSALGAAAGRAAVLSRSARTSGARASFRRVDARARAKIIIRGVAIHPPRTQHHMPAKKKKAKKSNASEANDDELKTVQEQYVKLFGKLPGGQSVGSNL